MNRSDQVFSSGSVCSITELSCQSASNNKLVTALLYCSLPAEGDLNLNCAEAFMLCYIPSLSTTSQGQNVDLHMSESVD